MKRITLWGMSTLSALVMLFSYHTSTEAVGATSGNQVATTQTGTGSSSNAGSSQTTTSGGSSGGAGNTSGSNTSGASSATNIPSSGTSTSGSTKTYTGDAVTMRYGTVQVTIKVANGKVVSASSTYPTDNGRDLEINTAAVPQLNSETAGQTTSSIDMVSGATYTSTAYIQSLQSALDQAKA